MTPYRKRLTRLTRRMADDMLIRNKASSTIDSYTWHVDQFIAHFGKPAEQLGPEEIRQYQLYATGLLEAGVDLLTIGKLLGHTSFTTTMVYQHVRRPHLDSTPSQLDWLPARQCPRWWGEPTPSGQPPSAQR